MPQRNQINEQQISDFGNVAFDKAMAKSIAQIKPGRLPGLTARDAKEAARSSVQNVPATILVVEDQVPLRKIARVILSKLGYNILEAGTGEEALRIWDTSTSGADLIITDIVMPNGMNGFDLVKHLLAKKTTLKYIFTSGYAPDGFKKEPPLRQGVDFLAKPYSIADLSRIVRSNLEDGTGAGQAAHD